MKYLSLDLETTGLDHKTCDVIMLSAIFEDTADLKPLEKLPHFTCYIRHVNYEGEAYALGMNGWIFKEISGQVVPKYPVHDQVRAMDNLGYFIKEHFGRDKPTLAGKNVSGFDWQFLKNKAPFKVHHRMIDVGSVFADFSKPCLPSLSQVKLQCNLGDEVAHDAYEDALDVIKVLRTKYT